MSKISVIIPTHNRPELLKKAIQSVVDQTYRDFELIVVDDGDSVQAEETVRAFNDPRIRYIQHEKSIGGAAARNTGIKNSNSQFIALLDDDDEWLPEKLEIQMKAFEHTSPDVGFCFTAVRNIYDNKEEITKVPEGVGDYFETVLKRFKTFLNVTLVIKRSVLDSVGYFDEKFPSHQEADLMIRVAKKYKGLGINKPLVLVNMRQHEHTGGSLERRIAGRKMILGKYLAEFKKRPDILAYHYFQLGLWLRNTNQFQMARNYFMNAFKTDHSFRYLLHFLTLSFNGRIYTLIRK